MNRRHLLRLSCMTLPAFSSPLALLARTSQETDAKAPLHPKLALPTAAQAAWQDLELGMFVHFAPNTWQDVESDDLSTPLSKIDPKLLNTEQWCDTAIALGAKYIVFVAKHQGGFCMWQTETTDYSIRNTPWKDGKGDVLREIANSCKGRGLKLGVYVCPRDDHFGAGTGGVCKTPELQARYDAMYREQLTEVFSRYGSLVEVWFDGSTVTPVGDLLAKYQPDAMVFQGKQATIRWVGNEDGFAPYPCWNGVDAADAHTGTATALDGDPDGPAWLPNEVDVSIRRPDWFWSTKNEKKVLTVDQLLSIYYRSVGRGAQLLLNIPANRDGLLPAPDTTVAAEFGRQIRQRFDRPLAVTSGTGRSVAVATASAVRINAVILQEDIRFGERVRAYRVEGKVNGKWITLGTGTAIGQKRIQPVAPLAVEGVRLITTQSVGVPMIRAVALYNTEGAHPADWDAVSSIWAQNLVGTWSDGRFSLDLSKRILVAGIYILRFHSQDGAVNGFVDTQLRIGGLSTPALLKKSHTRSDELVLDITGLASTITLSGRVMGAKEGSVLLYRP